MHEAAKAPPVQQFNVCVIFRIRVLHFVPRNSAAHTKEINFLAGKLGMATRDIVGGVGPC